MHSKARGTTRELLLSPTLEPAEGPWLQLQQTRCRRVLGARGCPNRNLLKTDKCFMSDRGIRTCDRRLKRTPYRARIGTHECAGMALISDASLTCGRTSLLLMPGAHSCLFHKQRRNCARVVEKFVDKESALFSLCLRFLGPGLRRCLRCLRSACLSLFGSHALVSPFCFLFAQHREVAREPSSFGRSAIGRQFYRRVLLILQAGQPRTQQYRGWRNCEHCPRRRRAPNGGHLSPLRVGTESSSWDAVPSESGSSKLHNDRQHPRTQISKLVQHLRTTAFVCSRRSLSKNAAMCSG